RRGGVIPRGIGGIQVLRTAHPHADADYRRCPDPRVAAGRGTPARPGGTDAADRNPRGDGDLRDRAFPRGARRRPRQVAANNRLPDNGVMRTPTRADVMTIPVTSALIALNVLAYIAETIHSKLIAQFKMLGDGIMWNGQVRFCRVAGACSDYPQ